MCVRDATPPVQVVHVDDVASALASCAVEADLDGVFNVAADGWLSHEEASALLPRRRMPGLPYEAAQRVLGALWSTGLGDAPPTMIPYLVHSWVVANDRLKEAGWEPRHSNDEAILLSSPANANNPLPWIAAVGAVVIGAVASTWWLARHRRAARA